MALPFEASSWAVGGGEESSRLRKGWRCGEAQAGMARVMVRQRMSYLQGPNQQLLGSPSCCCDFPLRLGSCRGAEAAAQSLDPRVAVSKPKIPLVRFPIRCSTGCSCKVSADPIDTSLGSPGVFVVVRTFDS